MSEIVQLLLLERHLSTIKKKTKAVIKLYTPHNSILISAEQSAFRKLWPSHWFARC